MDKKYYNKGLSDYHAQNYCMAIMSFSLCIKKNPENIDAYYNRGLSHFKLEDYQSALIDFNKVIEKRSFSNANYVFALYYRGRIRTNSIDAVSIADAINDFNEAISILPNYSEFHYYRNLAIKKNKRYAKKMGNYKR